MTVRDVVEKFKLTVFSGEQGLDREVKGGYVCDLLSDVMGHAKEGEVWCTLQAHKNIMAVAGLKDLAAIVIIKGVKPEDETVEVSNEEGVPVLGTGDQCFEFAGKLYDFINNK